MSKTCKICQGVTGHVDAVSGRLDSRRFELRRCDACGYAYIADPRLDFERIYDEDYYRGTGADPSVNYIDELSNPRSVRQHEWRGILRWVRSVTHVCPETRWLDYGCGAGGLVRFLQEEGIAHVVGHDQGHLVPTLTARGMPIASEADLHSLAGTCDVVTAIEVVEHAVDPLGMLSKMRSLLRPGGMLFLTTGNAAPHRHRLRNWGYLVPEVHISFFEPKTLAIALERSGFEPVWTGFAPGWDDIIRFKVLKSLRVKSTHPAERILPWSVLSRIVDWRLHPSAHPIGRAV